MLDVEFHNLLVPGVGFLFCCSSTLGSMKQAATLLNTFLSESLKSIDRLSGCVCDHLLITSDQPLVRAVPKHNRLSVITDSALLASQLRYQQQDLLKHVNKQMLTAFTHLDIKVSPAAKRRECTGGEREFLSNDTRVFIGCIADSIDDEALAESLKQLGNHYQRRPRQMFRRS